MRRKIEDRLVELLKAVLPRAEYRVFSEMPFEPGLNDRSANVGVVRSDRDAIAETSGVLPGAPEMVVEVWSPSSRRTELAAYRKLCFEHGTLVFWLVHPEKRTVAVTRRDDPGKTVTFEAGERVPLAPLSEGAVGVETIFS